MRDFARLLVVLIVGMGLIALAAMVCGADAPAGWTDAKPVAAAAVSTQQAEVAAAEVAATNAGPSASFRKTLSKAAEAAFREGKISRWDLARLRLAIALRPRAIAEAQACCASEAYNAGLIADASIGENYGFDWTNLLAFIKEFLPLILEIIKMFSV